MKNTIKYYINLIIFILIAIPIGAMIGIIDTIFGKILLDITAFRDTYTLYLIPFLSIAGVIIVYFYKKFGGKSNKGMNLIFEVGQKSEDTIPLRLIPLVISGTWLTHLFGGSAGREGVAVQIGGTVSHFIGKRIPIKNAPHIFLITGMAAGFAGLFQTPIAAVFFAIEVIMVGKIEFEALIPALTASFTASGISALLGLEKFTFLLNSNINFDSETIFKLTLLGIIFGIIGGMFAWCLKIAKNFTSIKLKNPLIRIFIIGICLSILFIALYKGRYCGLGTNLINLSFNNGIIYNYDWLLKFILTILTLSAGFQGGEVTPLFSIGASLGVALANIFNLPIEFMAALGYASVFGSATNTLFAPIFIGAEVFGYSYIPHFFIVCSIAYAFNRNKSIYSQKIL